MRQPVARGPAFVTCISLLALLLLSGHCAAETVRVSYLHDLSNFDGRIPYNWAVPFVDKGQNEVYVLDRRSNSVSVFNDKGMEVFRLPRAMESGALLDGTVEENGNLLFAVAGPGRSPVIRCDYRGIFVEEIPIRNLPAEFAAFSPDRIVYRNGLIYLADRNRMKIAVVSADGEYGTGYDVGGLIELERGKRESVSLVGFCVDGEGNIYFTIPVLFSAYRLDAAGKVSGFGKPGSAPGGFGVIADIDVDARGRIYITDTLKSVVMVFDRTFRFLTEFGSRGVGRGELLAPKDVAIDARGKVYIAQAGKRGISVFQVHAD